MTQRTLVRTPTQVSRPSHDKERTSASWRRDMMDGPPSSREMVDAVRKAVPSTTAAGAPVNDVTATSAHADQASKRGKTRREPPGTERGVSSRLHHGEVAPFRNTRARSRPVEPPPVTKVSTRDIAKDNGRKANTKGSEKRRERGEPVPSAGLEPDVQLDPELAPRQRQASTSKSATVVVREAHDDERVVKDLLEDGASAVSSGLPSGEDNENMLLPFRDIEVDVEKSLDKDDVDVGVEESSSVLEGGEDAVKELHD
ncbi:hypothetical protein SCLCIDRAFT_31008 [Scleroderma citrinum Foug A]|uniref:Uncharacterized protein n=1 Tax=Scleroderma citrinum Foug A TaxID=1036808 RepID=A0A0C3D162_9AGAM|nr:hypothetical protein SCLCIDRAFT_31008 [Scleroderma citrinum Foug A]